MTKKSFALCVFCGSSERVSADHKNLAYETGCLIADAGMTLVYGGGRIGLMGALAEGALANGGQVVGIIPKFLEDLEMAHPGLTKLHITQTMHERQSLMNQLSDGFMVLPGGYGTMAEFFEVLTWRQIGLHNKKIALINTKDFWNPLLHMLSLSADEGFIRASDQEQFSIYTSPQNAIKALSSDKNAV